MMLTPADIADLNHQQFSNDFLLKLRQIYSAENYCFRRLPLVVNKLPASPLLNLLVNHLPYIKARKAYIEEVFEILRIETGGTVCSIFKSLIGKAGSVIYHIRPKELTGSLELINILLEISIYRGHVYNNLYQTSESLRNTLITNVISTCIAEEDNFFYELLHIKKAMSLADGSKAKFSSFETV
jgi:ferritin-like metal-binding protein YciE